MLQPAPSVPAPPPLDHVQRAVVEREPVGRHQVVVGAPGSGKTLVALEAYLRRAAREHGGAVARHFLLAPTRVMAGELRRAASGRLLGVGTSRRSPGVYTPAAFAFWIVRQYAVSRGEPAPTLITGAQQDAILGELLAGHAAGVGGSLDLGGLPVEVLGIAAFREELRNLFMRAAEFALTPADLAAEGRAHGRPEWEMAARLLAEYQGVVALGDLPEERGERFDAAGVVSEAAILLENWEQFAPGPPPQIASVVVDDYQEAAAALVRLLTALAERGTHLTLVGDPDTAVQTFRGARPQFVGRARGTGELGGFGAELVTLPAVYRGGTVLRAAVQDVVGNVPGSGVAGHRAATVPADAPGWAGAGWAGAGPDGPLRVVKAGTVGGEAAHIAHQLRHAHLHEGLAWDQMAVVVRSAGAAAALQRALRGLVPANQARTAVVLRDEPGVRMLLAAIESAQDELTPELAGELLTSDVGGLDDLAVRRLRRYALAQLRAGGVPPEWGVDGVIARMLKAGAPATATPDSGPPPESSVGMEPPPLPRDLAEAVRRVAGVRAAAARALAVPDAAPREVLWAVWHATGLAEVWRSRALARGPLGERADGDLDAVMALFELAENFELRTSGGDTREFVAHVRAESLPSDTLAEMGQREPGVAVLTAAQAAGREWDLVVVAGVQEGSWPDTRVRDSVLGAGQLADAQLGRLGIGSAGARRETIGDEWRLFAAAISRARHRLIITAVEDDDQRPSAFFERMAEFAGEEDAAVPAVRRLDLRGIVAELRGRLSASDQFNAPPAAVTAGLLALLAEAQIPGADPDEWAGVGAPTALEPIYPPDGTVYVSPSRVEGAIACPLRWVLQSVGGNTASRIEQNVGTLIHEIAAEHPNGTLEELQQALAEKFDALGLQEGWLRERQLARAQEMIRRLADYMASVPGEVRTEVQISAQVGDALISGYVDRVEVVDGGVRIADLKTGGAAITAKEAEVNPQLGIYQLAVNSGESEQAVGARLVYLGTDTKNHTLRHQPHLPEEGGWARELLDEAIGVMRGSDFPARTSDQCRHCPVRRSCPADPLGRRSSR